MKDFLQSWSEDLCSSSPLSLRATVEVLGERSADIGPRSEKAKVRVVAHPADRFEVVNKMSKTEALDRLGHPEAVVFGILDVLMVSMTAPLRNVRLVLDQVEFDPIRSSAMAFRQAGRDAGRKIVEEWKKSPATY